MAMFFWNMNKWLFDVVNKGLLENWLKQKNTLLKVMVDFQSRVPLCFSFSFCCVSKASNSTKMKDYRIKCILFIFKLKR